MQYGYFNQNIRILLQFHGALNLVSPDPVSKTDTRTLVKIDVLGDDGAPVAPFPYLKPAPSPLVVDFSGPIDVGGATQYLLTVNHAKPPNTTVLRREVRATFTYQSGRPGETRVPYTILTYMSHGASAQAVRGYLGLTLSELPDEAIDLYAASLRALWDIGPDFQTALLASDQTRESARMAVVLQAASDLLPSIKMRIAQTVSDGARQFTRFSKADTERLSQQAANDYSYHKGVITGSSEDILGFFATSTQADPFTG